MNKNNYDNPRKCALESLIACEKNDKFTNLEINASLTRQNLSQKDKGLYTALVYGVAERMITLDYIISKISSRPLKEIDAETLNIIRLGLYQIIFMDRIPSHAAVSESVTLAPKRSSGFVNAVLRNYLRDSVSARASESIKFPDKESDRFGYLSVKYSAPIWLCRLWEEKYGSEISEKLLEFSIRPPKISLRVNTLKNSADDILTKLTGDGIPARMSDICGDMIVIDGSYPVSELTGLNDGSFYIQDESSGICIDILSPEINDSVLDSCAAPGGKSLSSAITMKNIGKIISCDIKKNKLGLLEKSCQLLGIDIIQIQMQDGRKKNPDFDKAFDKVLCDVPCSGLGVIAKKPDIRYKNPDDIEALPKIQYDILKNCSDYVKSGGILVYSTCTLNPDENENNVSKFLNEYKDSFEPYDFTLSAGSCELSSHNGMLTLFPHITGTDGFFIARMKRK